MRKLNVPDMSCEHCVRRITEALTDAGLDFRVDLPTHTVEVAGEDEALQTAIAALDDIGYEASSV